MRKRVFSLTLAAVFVAVLMAAVPTGQASANGGVHCVQYGETLYGIAARYGTTAHAIAHANGIYNPNYIRAGTCLVIPVYGGGWYGKPTYPSHHGGYYPPKKSWHPTPTYGYGHKKVGYPHYGKGTVHCVSYGETMSSIAWRYGTSAWAIANANGISNPNWIYAGQCLLIPTW